MTLLLVNDEIITAQTMARDIDWKACGISNVLQSYDANEARAIMEQESCVDIALLDIEMPGENGLELLSWIRKQRFDINCVFLTCHASFTYAQQAIQLGCEDYILAPARYSDIETVVKRVVRNRRQRQAQETLMKYGESWKKQLAPESDAGQTASTDSKIVEVAFAYVLTHLGDADLSVEGVARHCHISSVYLSRMYKKEKGHSLGRAIIVERLALAEKLLRESNLSAKQVAERCGYISYPHFSDTFKKWYGTSPAQYKQFRN